jgi:hypothetical protein
MKKHINQRIADSAPEQVFLTSVGLQIIPAVEQRVQIIHAHERTIFGEKACSTREGVIKIEEHGEQNKYAKDEQIGQDEDIRHPPDPQAVLQWAHDEVNQINHAQHDCIHRGSKQLKKGR